MGSDSFFVQKFGRMRIRSAIPNLNTYTFYSVTIIESFIPVVKELEPEEEVEPKEEVEEGKLVYSKMAFDDPNEGTGIKTISIHNRKKGK